MPTTFAPAPAPTTTPTAPPVPDRDTSDHRPPAHYVKEFPGMVTEAYVYGLELTALCGARFVPSRDPHACPPCEPCSAIMADHLTADL